MEPILLLSLIIVGLVAGLLGALFGIGGGIIIVPMLTICYGLSAADAAAVSLVGIVATSVGGTIYYMENNRFHDRCLPRPGSGELGHNARVLRRSHTHGGEDAPQPYRGYRG